MPVPKCLFAACIAALGLAACGDDAPGNTDPPPPPPPPQLRLEGLYSGVITQPDYNVSLVVLNDATLWGVYSSRAAIPVAFGVVQGAGVRNDATGSYVGSPDSRNYFFDGAQGDGQILGSYTATDVFAGFVPGLPPPILPAPWAFSTLRVAVTTYDYDSAAQLSAIVAEWAVVTPRGGSNMTILPTGVVGGSVAGCQVSGSIIPRPGGKNVFVANLEFGPPLPLAICDITGAASGIAVVTVVSDTRRQLMVAVQNAARTRGTGFFGDAPR
ncbi:MAG: hypothetical protein ABWY12_13230 [Burkholderiales bacterium]